MIRLRNENTELRKGDFRTVMAQAGSGAYCYRRSLGSSSICVLLNNQSLGAEIPATLLDSAVLWQEGLMGRTIAPMGFAVLKQVKKQ